jgi:hypothetical protein
MVTITYLIMLTVNLSLINLLSFRMLLNLP